MAAYFLGITILLSQLSAFAQQGLPPNDAELKTSIEELSGGNPKAQNFNPKDSSRAISLKEAIEEGLRNNPSERQRKFSRELNDIGWEDTYESFWYPNVNITMQTTTDQRIGRLSSGNSGDTNPNPDIPEGTVGLNLGEYSIFNWGKDYLDYLNSRTSYVRQKQSFNEQRRQLKQDLIFNYFNMAFIKMKEKIFRDQLRHAAFIYRLGREKASLRKISKQDYFGSRAEYLKAQGEYQSAQIDTANAEKAFAFLIGDDLESTYIMRDGLKFKRLKLRLEEALIAANVTSPPILEAKKNMENAQRGYERALREDLPLPEFTIELGSYLHDFGNAGGSGSYETYADSKNFEIVASINLTWTILGEDGFFNSRKRKTGLVNKFLNERKFYDTKRSAETDIRAAYQEILKLENQVLIAKNFVESTQSQFDVVLENYMNGKTPYAALRIVLRDQTNAEILYQQAKLNHLEKKIEMAKVMGVEDFPGESFEDLGIREK